jgi:phage repressor protein C with HTH and peptisase S24 domain
LAEPALGRVAEVKTDTPLRRGMFVAQIEGHSMEPLISDGVWCLFLRQAPRIREGMIAIVQHRDIRDPETGGNYTIKRIH